MLEQQQLIEALEELVATSNAMEEGREALLEPINACLELFKELSKQELHDFVAEFEALYEDDWNGAVGEMAEFTDAQLPYWENIPETINN